MLVMTRISHTHFKLNDVVIDCQNMTLARNGLTAKLPVKVFDYLKLFLDNDNHIVKHEDAINTIWDGNENVGKRGYINAMWQIRKAFSDIGSNSDDVFKTLPKVGYALTVKPERITPSFTSKLKQFPITVSVAALLIVATLAFVIIRQNAQSRGTDTIKFPTLTSVTNYQGVEEHPAVSHDGQYLAFKWVRENKLGALYIRNLAIPDSPLRLLSSGKYQEALPVWSPDDRELAYLRITEQNQCEVRVRVLADNVDKLIDDGCWYVEFKKMLDWSPDGKQLLYAKKVNGVTAYFVYDLATALVKQISFPSDNNQDLMAVWSGNSRDIVLVREKTQQMKLVLLSDTGKETTLLDTKESITGISRGDGPANVFINFSEKGKIGTYALNFSDSNRVELTQLNQIDGASGLSYDNVSRKLFVTKHQSSEYVVQRTFEGGRNVRRITSSYRDLYGRYDENTGSILFLSNRSSNWDLWRQNEKGAVNLTHGVGVFSFASLSPDGEQFVTTMVIQDDAQHFFIGDIRDQKLNQINTTGLVPEFPTWSYDGKRIYFSSLHDKHSGLYQYNTQTGNITQMTSTNEAFAVTAGADEFYVSRTTEDGIWRFTPSTQQFTKVVDNLSVLDFGSFFIQDSELYYVARTPQSDQVMKYVKEGDDAVVLSYPANTIRKFFGIAKGDSNSFLLTLNSVYDADVYSFSL